MTRDELIESCEGLVRKIAAGFLDSGRACGMTYDDIVGYGHIGLIKAAERYDPSRGTQFTTLAHPYIWGEIQRSIRDVGTTIKTPRGEKYKHTCSLDTLCETMPPREMGTEDSLPNLDILLALDQLTPEQRRAVTGIYGDGLSFKEVSRREGVTDMCIHKRAAKGLKTLRVLLRRYE